MKNLKLKLLAGLMGISSLGLAQAATETATMEVSTTVTASCTVTANNLTFPPFEQTATSATIQASTTIVPICSKGTPYSVTITAGTYGTNTGGFGAGAKRIMRHTLLGTSATGLAFSLFKEDGTTEISYSNSYSDVGDGYLGADQTITIISTLDTSQNVPAGSYSTTVTIRVEY